MSSKRKGFIRNLFTHRVSCGCTNPKLTDIISPRPKPIPKVKDSSHHHQMMLLNPLSSSSRSWERNGSTSRDREDEAEEDYTSTTFSFASFTASAEESGNCNPNTPCKNVAVESVLKDNIAVEKRSVDPYSDFQQSILQMIVQRKMYSHSDLQELLNCFLQLNSPLHHHTIIKAFTDLLHNKATYTTAGNINVQLHPSKSSPDHPYVHRTA